MDTIGSVHGFAISNSDKPDEVSRFGVGYQENRKACAGTSQTVSNSHELQYGGGGGGVRAPGVFCVLHFWGLGFQALNV